MVVVRALHDSGAEIAVVAKDVIDRLGMWFHRYSKVKRYCWPDCILPGCKTVNESCER